MTNEEFFHYQLRNQIQGDAAPSRSDDEPVRESWWFDWPAGLDRRCSLCGLLRLHCDRVTRQADEGQSNYLTQVINAALIRAVSPDANIRSLKPRKAKSPCFG